MQEEETSKAHPIVPSVVVAIRGRRVNRLTPAIGNQLKGQGSADCSFYQLARVRIFSDSNTVHCTLLAIVVTPALCAI
jgi:hypothetical protein